MSSKEKLVVALDCQNEKEVFSLLEKLTPLGIVWFKVGLRLFSLYGPDLLSRMRKLYPDIKIFLDLKYHDIPNTVFQAILELKHISPDMLTVHAQGGSAMLESAMQAASSFEKRPRIVAVTLLTSLNQNEIAKIGIVESTFSYTMRLAMLAKNSKVDGVVASAEEVSTIKRGIQPPFIVVTPGIRYGTENEKDDQKRIATPKGAINNGADFIVVGRPIIAASDPEQIAIKILDDIS